MKTATIDKPNPASLSSLQTSCCLNGLKYKIVTSLVLSILVGLGCFFGAQKWFDLQCTHLVALTAGLTCGIALCSFLALHQIFPPPSLMAIQPPFKEPKEAKEVEAVTKREIKEYLLKDAFGDPLSSYKEGDPYATLHCVYAAALIAKEIGRGMKFIAMDSCYLSFFENPVFQKLKKKKELSGGIMPDDLVNKGYPEFQSFNVQKILVCNDFGTEQGLLKEEAFEEFLLKCSEKLFSITEANCHFITLDHSEIFLVYQIKDGRALIFNPVNPYLGYIKQEEFSDMMRDKIRGKPLKQGIFCYSSHVTQETHSEISKLLGNPQAASTILKQDNKKNEFKN